MTMNLSQALNQIALLPNTLADVVEIGQRVKKINEVAAFAKLTLPAIEKPIIDALSSIPTLSEEDIPEATETFEPAPENKEEATNPEPQPEDEYDDESHIIIERLDKPVIFPEENDLPEPKAPLSILADWYVLSERKMDELKKTSTKKEVDKFAKISAEIMKKCYREDGSVIPDSPDYLGLTAKAKKVWIEAQRLSLRMMANSNPVDPVLRDEILSDIDLSFFEAKVEVEQEEELEEIEVDLEELTAQLGDMGPDFEEFVDDRDGQKPHVNDALDDELDALLAEIGEEG